MQNFYQNNKKAILAVAGVGAVTALLATIYTHQSKSHVTLHPRTVPKKTEAPSAADERRYQQRQEKPVLNTAMNVEELILSSIPVEYENGVLSLATVNRINATAADLAVSELLEAIKENRRLRRENKDNLQKYVDLYYENLQKIREIGEKHQRDVLKQLNLTEEALKNAYTHHSLNENTLVNALNDKLQSNLLATRELTAAELEPILQDEWDSLRNAANTHLAQIRGHVREAGDASKIALLNAYDAIFAKHSIEEEDIRAGKVNHADASNLRDLLSNTAEEHKRFSEL